MNNKRSKHYLSILLCSCALSLSAGICQSEELDFADLSLEELLQIDISTFDRTSRSANELPVAISVITAEDIRRSTAYTLPQLLRQVPGMHVQRIDSNSWAISSRGFAGKFANKMLVLIDGRSVYNTGFSGVFWDSLDIALETIERIEVIRGPGGSAWGANAVNGIINIIRKTAQNLLGNEVSLSGGNEVQSATVRYGENSGMDSAFALHSKFSRYDDLHYGNQRDILLDSEQRKGQDLNEWWSSASGFRYDIKEPTSNFFLAADALFVGGSAVGTVNRINIEEQYIQPEVNSLSHNNLSLQVGYEKELSETSNFYLRSYLSHNSRREASDLTIEEAAVDVDSQINTELFAGNHLIMGVAGRWVEQGLYSENSSAFIAADPAERTLPFASLLLQDSQIFFSDRLNLIFGLKVTHNRYTEFDFQPSLRASVKLDEKNFIWSAISRAARVPGRVETDFSQLGVAFSLDSADVLVDTAQSTSETEEVTAYELGFRTGGKSYSIEIAAFYNDYQNLSLVTPEGSPFFGSVAGISNITILPYQFTQDHEASSFGGEINLRYEPSEGFTLLANYSYLNSDFDLPQDVFTAAAAFFQHNAQHMASITTRYDLTSKWELDLYGRYVDTVSIAPHGIERLANHYVSPILQLDLRLAYKTSLDTEISILGRNLIGRNREHIDTTALTYSAVTTPEVIFRVSTRF